MMPLTDTALAPRPAGQDDRDPLDRLLDPHSIAIIGASTNPSKRGYHAVRALQEANYSHPIYPVNPNAKDILGLTAVPSITELPGGIDAALIALPGAAVPDALRDCARAGIRGAIVLANGFKEVGDRGAELERRLQDAIAETGIRVIGPNTSGMLNVTLGANLVGLPGVPAGPISVVTQSGNMLLSLVNDDKQLCGPGFHAYVGLGNQADVRYDECITTLACQPETGAVALHSEGFRNGRALLESIAATSPTTPVVLLRGGRSEIGQRTALSHTGSIAGSDAVATAVLRQAGAELVDRSDELAMLAGTLATTPPIPAGRKVAILSDGGGHATLAADALSAAGVTLADISDSTREQLSRVLGPAAATHNPIDVAGATDADPALFATCVDTLMDDPEVGLVLIVGLFGGYHVRFDPQLRTAENETAESLLNITTNLGTPLLVQSCYAAEDLENHSILRSGGVQVLSSIDHAVRAVTALHRRGIRMNTADQRSPLHIPAAAAAPEQEGSLDEPSARRLVESVGIDVGPWTLAETPDAAAEAVHKFDQPCALKVVSPQVLHKSEAGGVELGVTADDAADRATTMFDNVAAQTPGAEITGTVITPMAPFGVELLIGATRDPIYGPVVAFGSGGVLVEALNDVTFRAGPFTPLEAHEMIAETLASRMIDGYRHLPPVDREALAMLLVRVGDMMVNNPQISELDLNPVIASGGTIRPVDVRIVLSR